MINQIRAHGVVAVTLAFAGLIAPLLALLAPLGFTPLFIVTSLVVILATWRQGLWRRLPRPLLVMTAVVVCWTALTAFWAVDPLRSLRSAAVLAAMTMTGLMLMEAARTLGQPQRRLVLNGLMTGVLMGLAYVLVDIVCKGSVTVWIKDLPIEMDPGQLQFLARQKLGRGITILVLMAWVAAAIIWRRPWAAIVMLAVTFFFALWSWSAASKLAMGIALTAALLAGWRSFRVLAVAAIAILTVAVPLAAYHLPGPAETAQWSFMPFTNHHRLTIWQFVGQRIAEKPILGWGMDSARDMPGGDEKSVIWVGSMEVPEQLLPLHPHNGILQWWLELGAIGAVSMAGWVCMVAWRAYRHRPKQAFFVRALGPSLFSGVVLVGLVSFGFWQSWWQSFLWLLATWALVVWRHMEEKQ